MKSSFLYLSALLSLSALANPYERNFSIHLMKNGKIKHRLDPFKEEYTAYDDKVLKFAIAGGIANSIDAARPLIPLIHHDLRMQYIDQCRYQEDTAECKQLRENITFWATLPLYAHIVEQIALQEAKKLKQDLPRGSSINVVIGYNVPDPKEEDVVAIFTEADLDYSASEIAPADTDSSASSESTPSESSN